MTVAAPVSIARDRDIDKLLHLHHRLCTVYRSLLSSVSVKRALQFTALTKLGLNFGYSSCCASFSLLFLPSTIANHILEQVCPRCFASAALVLLALRFSPCASPSARPLLRLFLDAPSTTTYTSTLTKIFHHDLHQKYVRYASPKAGRTQRVLAAS